MSVVLIKNDDDDDDEQQPLYRHYTGQPVLGDVTPVKNWRTQSQQSFTTHMPLLTAT